VSKAKGNWIYGLNVIGNGDSEIAAAVTNMTMVNDPSGVKKISGCPSNNSSTEPKKDTTAAKNDIQPLSLNLFKMYLQEPKLNS
jgi:hypothetical protein